MLLLAGRYDHYAWVTAYGKNTFYDFTVSPELMQTTPTYISVYVAYTAAAQAVPSTVALYNSQAVQLVYYMQQQPVQLEHIAEENTMLRSQVATLQNHASTF